MPQTPLTGSSAYATADDLKLFKDARQVDQLAADGGDPSDAAVGAILAAASGRVEEYALVGGRYTPDDLAALAGNAQARLKELVCELAFFRLKKRRWPNVNDKELADVLDSLQRLADGVTVFGTVEATEAGKPEVTRFIPDDDRSVVRRAARLFGSRNRCDE